MTVVTRAFNVYISPVIFTHVVSLRNGLFGAEVVAVRIEISVTNMVTFGIAFFFMNAVELGICLVVCVVFSVVFILFVDVLYFYQRCTSHRSSLEPYC